MTKLFTKNKKLSSIYGSLTYPTKKCFINHNFTIKFAKAARFPITNFKTLLAPEIVIQKFLHESKKCNFLKPTQLRKVEAHIPLIFFFCSNF